MTPRRPIQREDERGFTLVELLMAMTITLVVLATTLGGLDEGIRATEVSTLVAEMQHNGRAGLALLTRDVMQAGQGIPLGGIPIPSGNQAAPINRPGPGAMTFPSTWVVLPSVSPGSALGPMVQGRPTDLITVLYADATLPLSAEPLEQLGADGSWMQVPDTITVTDAANGINPGDFIMFSNAQGNAIQEVTSVDGQNVAFGGNDSMRFNQRSVGQGTIMQLQTAPGQFPPTTATRVLMISYYVDTSTPSSPRLIRRVNNGPGRPVALDVEDLQITYDLVDGITNPVAMDDATDPYAPAHIRKVNLSLSTRSSREQRITGTRSRQTLTTQVSLRSLSFRDRYQ